MISTKTNVFCYCTTISLINSISLSFFLKLLGTKALLLPGLQERSSASAKGRAQDCSSYQGEACHCQEEGSDFVSILLKHDWNSKSFILAHFPFQLFSLSFFFHHTKDA